MKIGVFDSGRGGTTVLEAIKELLPENEYYYIADSKNCPYGEKTDDELMRIVRNNVDELKEWGAEIVVIACNTATTKCIEMLRELYPELKFVGTEPAIKLATKSDAKNILVMATPGTVHSERMMSLLKENQKEGQEVELLACSGLADAIEEEKEIDKVLASLLESVRQPDLVVLGCTHYSLIKEKIQNYFPRATLIDGNEGVARRVAELVKNPL